jgi:hypothetical protein
MSETMKKVEAYKKKLLQELLSEITEEQRDFFNKIFPDGVSSDKMESAYSLIERTITKNKNL